MTPFALRWINFRGFTDTGWQEIRPLTIVIGSNASGKTSLTAPLLMLKQTLQSTDLELSLKTQGELFNAGSFRNLIHNHEVDRHLGLQLRFHTRPGKERKPGVLGETPPGILELEFGQGEVEGAAVLDRFTVRDDYERVMLSRLRLASGKYSVRGLPTPLKGDFSRSIRASKPHHFLFELNDVFRRIFAQERRGEVSEAIEPSKAESLYFSIITHIGAHIRTLLQRIAYLGPLRARPRRLYEVSGERPLDVGTRGEFAPEVMFLGGTDLLSGINDWLAHFGLGFQLACEMLTEGAFAISLQRTKSSPKINIADAGFGLSQVLPLIVQGLYCRNGLMIAEQPEIHLNPRLQARLADLFVEVAKRENTVIVETHSEHLFLRIRRLIAEKKFSAADVAVFYTERSGDVSRLRQIRVARNGHIEPSEWPAGFFEDSLPEALALATAQAEGGRS